MRWLLALTSVLSIWPGQIPGPAVDVSKLALGSPVTVAELDLGKLKGQRRQLAWSRAGAELYIHTADGNPPSERLRHFLLPAAGGAPKPIDGEPEWAPIASVATCCCSISTSTDRRSRA